MTVFIWRGKRLIWRSDGQPPGRQRWKFRDAMRPRHAQEPVIRAFEGWQSIFSDYLLGKLPSWANHEFEQLLLKLEPTRQKLGRSIGRNGRPPEPRERCREEIIRLKKLREWPGHLTDEEWANKLHVGVRTYQRAKEIL
jgi:hypothetical protein